MKYKKIIFLSLTMIVSLSLSGCGTANKVDTSTIDGGVFKTADNGNTWQQRALIPTTTGQPLKFSSVNNLSMEMDPGNEKVIYYGSIGNGLLYTLDGGGSWQQVAGLQNATIMSIAVDPRIECSVYVAIANKIYKTTDCTREWKNVYYESDLKVTVNSIAVDHYDSNIVYFGNSRGDLIKSVNGSSLSATSSMSWKTIYRFGDKIQDIKLDQADSRIIYVVTGGKGIFRSLDGGVTWDDSIGKALESFKLGQEVKTLAFVKSEPKMLFIATKYGLIRSSDKGKTWEQIALIQPDNNATINALAVNPQNSKDIYYSTYTTFFRSFDSGKTWTTIKLPSSRAGWRLLIDPVTPNVIYMGVRSLK